MKSINVLLVDDEPDIIKWMKKDLQSQSYIVHSALSGTEALTILYKVHIDVLITDIKMPGMGGMELIKKAQELIPHIQCIVFTGHGELDTAIKTIQLGGLDYLLKPVEREKLFAALKKAIEIKEKHELLSIAMDDNKAALIPDIEKVINTSKNNIVGRSEAVKKVFELIAQVTPSDSTVLITGESGTGKELVAKAIHDNSHRCNYPFVVVNCAAIPDTLLESELFGYVKGAFTGAMRDTKGRFEDAHRGTIFLDEIGDMPLGDQAKILRALQEKKVKRVGDNKSIDVDVRIVAATNKDLTKAVSKGAFREDVFYRLNVFPIHIPPLRERKEDIELLVNHFIEKLNPLTGSKVKSLTPKALEKLEEYNWPGNIRELENTIERALIKTKGKILQMNRLDLPYPGPVIDEQNKVYSMSEAVKKESVEKDDSPYGAVNSLNSPLIRFVRRVIVGKINWADREGYIFDEGEKLKALAEELRGDGSKMAKVLNVKKNNLNQTLRRHGIKLREIKLRYKNDTLP